MLREVLTSVGVLGGFGTGTLAGMPGMPGAIGPNGIAPPKGEVAAVAGVLPVGRPQPTPEPLPEAEPLPTPPVEFPHPLITEVLYAVPTKHGDANLDGERQTTGDEFVELINPHARPIRLGGYTLVDAAPSGGTQFRFVFPPMTLQPGQVVVVFNGHDSNIAGPIGDSATPPRERHPSFGNAWVLTARARSTRAGFANTADYVMLLDPKDRPIQCVLWGDAEDPKLPEGHGCLIERAPSAGDGSVQRRGIEGGFMEHPPYRPEGAGMEVSLMTFSPGVFVVPGLTRLEDLPPYKGER